MFSILSLRRAPDFFPAALSAQYQPHTGTPDDEKNWGPCNRLLDHRRPYPSDEDIYFHQMSSFEQGQASARQYLANTFESCEITEKAW